MFWRALYHLAGIGEPWHPDPAPFVDLTSPTVQALIATPRRTRRASAAGISRGPTRAIASSSAASCASNRKSSRPPAWRGPGAIA